MNILLVNSQIPMIRGGAEVLVESLARQLRLRGHRIQSIRIPFHGSTRADISKAILANSFLRLPRRGIDRTIFFKFPSYLIPAEKKRIWLLHQFREVYDLWGTEYSFGPTPENEFVRDWIHTLDRAHLKENVPIYPISQLVDKRLEMAIGRAGNEVLYPPLDHPEHFYNGPRENYFVFPGRISSLKRQWLAVEAFAKVKTSSKLVFLGKPDSAESLMQLQQMVERHHLQSRVEIRGFVPESEKAKLISESLAVINLPFQEDYGYVTLEAFQARRPVITCHDSGGTTEFVQEGKNGWVVDPTSDAIANAMNEALELPNQTRQLGETAFTTLVEKRIHWDHVIETLLR
jgi:glycosyltransferase involved in cell wall biosynthesis